MLNLLQDSSLSTKPGPQNSSAVAKVQGRGRKFPPLEPNPVPTANEIRGGGSHWESPGRTCTSCADPGSDLFVNLWQTSCSTFGLLGS